MAVDDDAQVLHAPTRDLRNAYRKDYRVHSTESAREALDALKELKQKNEVVALFVSDQRMPEMLGVEFLVEARKKISEAKRVPITAYSDTDAAIKAINEVRLDYCLTNSGIRPKRKCSPS